MGFVFVIFLNDNSLLLFNKKLLKKNKIYAILCISNLIWRIFYEME